MGATESGVGDEPCAVRGVRHECHSVSRGRGQHMVGAQPLMGAVSPGDLSGRHECVSIVRLWRVSKVL